MLVCQEKVDFYGMHSCSIRSFDPSPLNIWLPFASWHLWIDMKSAKWLTWPLKPEHIFRLAACSQSLFQRGVMNREGAPVCQVLIEVREETNKHKLIFKQEQWHYERKIKQLGALAKAGYESLVVERGESQEKRVWIRLIVFLSRLEKSTSNWSNVL